MSLLEFQSWLCLTMLSVLCFREQDPRGRVTISVPFPRFLHMSFSVLIFFFSFLITGNLIKELSDISNLSCSGNYYTLMQQSFDVAATSFFH